MSAEFENFLGGLLIGFGACALLLSITGSTFRDGRSEVRKEAIKHGYMFKEVGPDDEILYKWKESK